MCHPRKSYQTTRGHHLNSTCDSHCEIFVLLSLLLSMCSISSQGMMTREAREMWRDVRAYRNDRWNVIDLPVIGLLTAGWVYRIVDNDSPWGTGFYALGTPLLFSRILHFTQIHQFQGPMIQVSRMTALHRLACGPGIISIVVTSFLDTTVRSDRR